MLLAVKQNVYFGLRMCYSHKNAITGHFTLLLGGW